MVVAYYEEAHVLKLVSKYLYSILPDNLNLYAINMYNLKLQVQNEEVVTNQLVRELRSLNYHRHDNILSLYAYSINDSEACLVYQFMANGSLEDRLLCKVLII